MPRPKKHDLYVAKEAFHCVLDGDPTFVREGERVRAGHPLLKQFPDYFEPADTDLRFDDVEQATAAPGELRHATTTH